MKFKLFLKKLYTLPFELFIYLFIFIEECLNFCSPKHFKGLSREKLIKRIDSDLSIIKHTVDGEEVNLKIFTPNYICNSRVRTFAKKEPETLKWIQKYGGTGALFDVGANIGLYSIFFAKLKKGNVYSFEPSAFNQKQLAKNISINNFEKKIKIISNPLFDDVGFQVLKSSNDQEGGAHNAFGVDYGYDGKKLFSSYNYSLLGLSIDFLIDSKIIPELPEMIKIDVDGIEHIILKGAKKTLKNKKCKTILIEVNDNFHEQSSNIYKILKGSGFKLINSQMSDILSKNQIGSLNQIWIKK